MAVALGLDGGLVVLELLLAQGDQVVHVVWLGWWSLASFGLFLRWLCSWLLRLWSRGLDWLGVREEELAVRDLLLDFELSLLSLADVSVVLVDSPVQFLDI